jgi:MoxR-like ATPase
MADQLLHPDVTQFERLAADLAKAQTALRQAVRGQDGVIEQLLVTLLSGGHGLIVGVPGIAKTTLVRALGAVCGLDMQRIQFTPDLMPADILGSEIVRTDSQGDRRFAFVPGPVFAQLVMADEINRASPRTQAALLEAMQEAQVTVAGETRPLPTPFHVFATQNPIEQDGTYPLPEAQLDRFLLQIDMGFPSADVEADVVMMTTGIAQPAPQTILSQECRRLCCAQRLIWCAGRGLMRAIRCNGDQGHAPRKRWRWPCGRAPCCTAAARQFWKMFCSWHRPFCATACNSPSKPAARVKPATVSSPN